jgi:hypothetical protein
MVGFNSENTENLSPAFRRGKKRVFSRHTREKYPDQKPVLSHCFNLPLHRKFVLTALIKEFITITLS